MPLVVSDEGFCYLGCDVCGERRSQKVYGPNNGQDEVREVTRKAGWFFNTDSGRAVCPLCREEKAKGAQHGIKI